MREKILDNLDNFVFAKDKNFKFLYCNEKIAEVAGLDSPSQIKGKTDYDLCWKKHADFYRKGDSLVLGGGTRINVPEIQTQPTKVATILITKSILKDKKENAVGIVGSYIDITGYTLTKNNGYYDENEHKFYLGEFFGNRYFTLRELLIFRAILSGHSVDRIAKEMHRSKKTIESHIAKIIVKLDCCSKNEITTTAIQFGLTYILECPDLVKLGA